MWYGGGCDLTPFYPHGDDFAEFHAYWRGVCDKYDAGVSRGSGTVGRGLIRCRRAARIGCWAQDLAAPSPGCTQPGHLPPGKLASPAHFRSCCQPYCNPSTKEGCPTGRALT